MKKLIINQNTAAIPWFESDFAGKILKDLKINKKTTKDINFFIDNGYVVLKKVITKNQINKILKDFNKIINTDKFKKNPEYFHYNKSPRVVEGWKVSRNIKEVCFNKKIINFLKILYHRDPLPISTINFIRGTEQPLHSDYIHFGSIPELFLAGAWFALEDVDENNGPLNIVPKSHKLNTVDFTDLNMNIPKTTKELKKNYTIYEEYLKKLVKIKKLKEKKILIEKGDAIIWAANLLHGGTKIKMKNTTRYSQVVHYHFKGLDKIYNPCFSSRMHGIHAIREIKKIVIK